MTRLVPGHLHAPAPRPSSRDSYYKSSEPVRREDVPLSSLWGDGLGNDRRNLPGRGSLLAHEAWCSLDIGDSRRPWASSVRRVEGRGMGVGSSRNLPCSCGSGVKAKRCHGAPHLGEEDGLIIINEHQPYEVPLPLTGNMCLRQTERVREGLAHFGVQLPEGSDLLRMLRSLESLGRLGEQAFWDAGLSEAEKRDSPFIEQISGLADVLEGLQSARVSGDVGEHLKRLRRPIDSLLSTRGEAQDFLAELEVAATLARGGLSVTVAEPDLQVRGLLGDLPSLGLPVKRPRAVKSAIRSLDNAARQARKCGLPCVTVLSLDAIVCSRPDGRPWDFLSDTREALGRGSWRRFRQVVREIETGARFRTRPEVLGIIFVAKIAGSVVPHDHALRPSYARDFCMITALNHDHWEGHNGTLMQLLHAFKKGLPG